jgi:hypothetical protein
LALWPHSRTPQRNTEENYRLKFSKDAADKGIVTTVRYTMLNKLRQYAINNRRQALFNAAIIDLMVLAGLLVIVYKIFRG